LACSSPRCVTLRRGLSPLTRAASRRSPIRKSMRRFRVYSLASTKKSQLCAVRVGHVPTISALNWACFIRILHLQSCINDNAMHWLVPACLRSLTCTLDPRLQAECGREDTPTGVGASAVSPVLDCRRHQLPHQVRGKLHAKGMSRALARDAQVPAPITCISVGCWSRAACFS
jgi:hypothetical protein